MNMTKNCIILKSNLNRLLQNQNIEQIMFFYCKFDILKVKKVNL
jgi:hypothetical protein